MPKEKPLLFCARSIQAWQQGIKTQTRRLVKPQPDKDKRQFISQDDDGSWWLRRPDSLYMVPMRQPYAVGDICWIREALVRGYLGEPRYEADLGGIAGWDGTSWYWHRDKLPAMFMPRWACRYHARIVSRRPERLQDITDDDAVAEGTLAGLSWPSGTVGLGINARDLYAEWWNDLHRKPEDKWEANPIVWRYEIEEAADGSAE